MITVYGDSDDFIVVEGDIFEDFGVYAHETPVWLSVSEGTVLEVTYDSCWKIEIVTKGIGNPAKKLTSTDTDYTDYSDVVEVYGTITSVTLSRTGPESVNKESMKEEELTVWLYSDSGGADKWYASQVLQTPNGWRHLCRSGRRLSTDVVQADNHYDDYETALAKHESVVKSKMKGSSAYYPVNASFLGFTDSTNIIVPDPVPGVFAKEIISPPMLFTSISRERMLTLLEDDSYLAQRKMNGTRLQVIFSADKVYQALNKEGTAAAVPGEVIRYLQTVVKKSTTEERFDGELIGGVFYVFDRPIIGGISDTRFLQRAMTVMQISTENPHVRPVSTAIGTTSKKAMLALAQSEGWEGLVLKRKDGIYKPGRSKEDYKFKDCQLIDAYLTALNTTSKGENSARMEIPMTLTNGKVERKFIGNVTIPASVEKASGGRMSREDVQALIRKSQAGEGRVIAEINSLYYDLNALHQPVFARLRDDILNVEIDQELKGKEGKRL